MTIKGTIQVLKVLGLASMLLIFQNCGQLEGGTINNSADNQVETASVSTSMWPREYAMTNMDTCPRFAFDPVREGVYRTPYKCTNKDSGESFNVMIREEIDSTNGRIKYIVRGLGINNNYLWQNEKSSVVTTARTGSFDKNTTSRNSSGSYRINYDGLFSSERLSVDRIMSFDPNQIDNSLSKRATRCDKTRYMDQNGRQTGVKVSLTITDIDPRVDVFYNGFDYDRMPNRYSDNVNIVLRKWYQKDLPANSTYQDQVDADMIISMHTIKEGTTSNSERFLLLCNRK